MRVAARQPICNLRASIECARLSPRLKFPVNVDLIARQKAARAELLRKRQNVDRPREVELPDDFLA